jgi:hypothetical protein
MEPLEGLPTTLNRRSWLILGILLVVSLPFRNTAVTLGILCGGLVAIGGFYWLRRSLRQLLAEPGPAAKARYQFGYLVRLVALAIVLAVLIAVVKIHTGGLLIGLSVVVINLFWTTIQHSLRH